MSAHVLRLPRATLRLEHGHPLLMGVVNASPESFYDGAAVGGLAAQLERARMLLRGGAAIVDVGGESGVTDRVPVPASEEIRRVVPLVEALAREGATVSVDTWKAEVAREAIGAGAAMVNDPSGLCDPGMAAACAEGGAALVLTHTRARPKRKVFPVYDDVVEDAVRFLADRVDAARAAGMDREALVVDPGPDLAKTPAQTVTVLRELRRFEALERPILLAVSRKDFVGALVERPPGERLAGTLAAVARGVDAGASIVRTHDVAATADFLSVSGALGGGREVPDDLFLDRGLRREGRA